MISRKKERKRESVCVCVCEREREKGQTDGREKERDLEKERERKREREMRESRERGERERERERERREGREGRRETAQHLVCFPPVKQLLMTFNLTTAYCLGGVKYGSLMIVTLAENWVWMLEHRTHSVTASKIICTFINLCQHRPLIYSFKI